MFIIDYLFLIPELFLSLAVSVLLILGTSLTTSWRKILITNFGYLTIFLILLFFFLCLQLPAVEYCLLQYQYIATYFSFWFRILFLLLFVSCLALSLNYFFVERLFFIEYFFLVVLFCISSFFLISANDFVLFYLALELQALIVYTMATLKRYAVFSTESGLKYFVLGALSSGLLLFGISIFYGFFGTFNFSDLKFLFLKWADVNFSYTLLLPIIFIISGLLFKLAAAPFHIWTPDVYEGAPSPVVLFFAILPKFAMLGFITRFFLIWLYDIVAVWYIFVFFSGLLSVIVGTFAALNQLNIKRLYAYSAIVNVGYILTAISYGTYDGIVAGFNYLITYFVATFMIFTILMYFRNYVSFAKLKYLVEYRLYASQGFLVGTIISLIFFSLAGVPPLAGFFIKFFLFKTLFSSEFLSNAAFFIILIMSVVSAFYYIRVIRFIFFTTKRKPFLFAPVATIPCFFLVNCCAVLIGFVFYQPTVYILLGLVVSTLF